MKPKIIHTKKFSCADDHPIVWYIFDDNNKAMCEYCATQFVYEPTHSEEMQDKLEPIPCPMHEDYDDEEDYKQNQGKND